MATNIETGGIAQKAQDLVDALLRLGIDGVGPLKSARESADEARRKSSCDDDAIRSLIRVQVGLAGAQGFVANVGGIVALPVAIPANIGASFLIQTHLVAAIAHLRGHDLDDESVRAAIVLCLLGNGATEVAKRVGIQVGEKITLAMIKKLPIEVIRAVNKKLGFMLIAKYGTKRSLIVLAKWIPLVGGLVGAGFDAAATGAVGAFAKGFFTSSQEDNLKQGKDGPQDFTGVVAA